MTQVNTCTAVIKHRLKYAPMSSAQAFDVLGMNVRGADSSASSTCRGEGYLYNRAEGRLLELLQEGHKRYRNVMKSRHGDHEAAVVTNVAWESLKKRFRKRNMSLH